MKEKTFDILIVGGGLTGLLTGYVLSLERLNIAIIDNNDFFDFKNVNFDFRTTAIAAESKNFLDKVGLWKKIIRFSEPIKKNQSMR